MSQYFSLLMDIIKARYSIRKYTGEQPKSKPRKPERIKIVE